MADADDSYGSDEVRLERLMDAAHCLTVDEKHELNERLDDFEARFPQLFFALYLDDLPEGTRMDEFGFWLLNRAAIVGIGETRPNDNGVMLCVDIAGGEASLITGYLPERLLPPRVLRKALQKAKPELRDGRYGEGILKVMDYLDHQLRKAAMRLSRRAGALGAGAAQPLPPSLKPVRGETPMPKGLPTAGQRTTEGRFWDDDDDLDQLDSIETLEPLESIEPIDGSKATEDEA